MYYGAVNTTFIELHDLALKNFLRSHGAAELCAKARGSEIIEICRCSPRNDGPGVIGRGLLDSMCSVGQNEHFGLYCETIRLRGAEL